MLINAFFGTVTNAAYFYAFTLQNYVNQFVNNFDAASAPQITQNVGSGLVDTAIKLARRSCRICLMLFLLLFFPLWSELEFLMRLWLGSNMPPETVLMARWTLGIAAISTTAAGLTQLINAFGRIKWYKIEISILYVLCLPAGYLLFQNGAPAYTILICFVVADILNNIQNLYKAANKREIIKIQDEFFKIYVSEDLEHLERFAKELDTISEGYSAQSLR